MFQYQLTRRFFAQVTEGVETLAAEELERLGALDLDPAYRGLYFVADDAALYRVNYRSRLVTRVIAPLETFECHTARYLYNRARELPWEAVLSPDRTFAVFANVANSRIAHSKYAALRVKDAIADRFRDLTGRRPSVDTTDPYVWVSLYIQGDRATIGLDTSGGSLHRRGYRVESVEAPMQEHVAAAVIAMSGWDGARPLVDPMCGSGTLLAEAFMRAASVPAGTLRPHFGFERLPDFEPAVWRAVRAEADDAVRTPPPGLVSGSDADAGAVRAARANLAQLPGGRRVRIERRRFQDIERLEGATIVCNPPYGLRLGDRDAMPEFIRGFGDFLKRRCAGSEAIVYFGRRELIKEVGLRTSWKKPLRTGGLDGRVVRYELY